MEKPIKLIRIPLFITGFDLFNKAQPVRNTIFRTVWYLSNIWLSLSVGYTFAQNKTVEFADRVFLMLASQASGIVIVQSVHFWRHQHKVSKLFDEINDLHKVSEDQWIESHSRITFAKCSAFVNKVSM